MNKKFNRVLKLINSNDDGKKFLAAIVSFELSQKGILKIDSDKFAELKQILNSNKKVELCSGCTFFEEYTMKELFERKNDSTFTFGYEFKKWFEYNLNK